MTMTYIWNYGTSKKHEFDVENKVNIKRITTSGPSLSMARVPGIGRVYTYLVSRFPAASDHFVTKLSASSSISFRMC